MCVYNPSGNNKEGNQTKGTGAEYDDKGLSRFVWLNKNIHDQGSFIKKIYNMTIARNLMQWH